MLKSGLIAAAALLLLAAACNTANDETAPPSAGPGGGTVTVNDVTFKWKPNGAFLDCNVESPTTGWVAVGFDPSLAMKDANFIIGYVDAGGVHIRDDYGSGLTAHDADVNGGGTDNVTNKTGTETAGRTQINFTIPMDAGDARDRKLALGQTYTILLASGPDGADDFTTQHQRHGSTVVTF